MERPEYSILSVPLANHAPGDYTFDLSKLAERREDSDEKATRRT
ncbi:MAG: hypothetical protein NVSMB14_14660 [Isosphaeraceae bacterium]